MDLPSAGMIAASEIPAGTTDHAGLIAFAPDTIIARRSGRCVGVGHRIVHGGSQFSKPIRINWKILACLAEPIPLPRGA